MKKFVVVIVAIIVIAAFFMFNGKSDFQIEGKWKSVGSTGYGQAQPGAIVIFDGENCNFFSPQDTYAVYPNGDGTYTLDVTSFFFADTLSFTIEVIDNDDIIIRGTGPETELQRIE